MYTHLHNLRSVKYFIDEIVSENGIQNKRLIHLTLVFGQEHHVHIFALALFQSLLNMPLLNHLRLVS